MDFTTHGAEQTLKWVMGESAAPPTVFYIQLHVGDPGPIGVDNPAQNTERQPVTFAPVVTDPGTDGSAHAETNLVAAWTNAPAAETYTHVTVWDAETGGNCWYKTEMVLATPVVVGGMFAFADGQKVTHL